MFRLFILDNGLDKISGHHFNQTLGLQYGAIQLGYQPEAFCGKISESIPDITSIAKPVFRKILYRPNPFLQIEEHAHFFANECNQHLPELKPTDVIFFPNVNYDEIRAIAILVEKRKISQKVIVRLLYYPHGHEREYFNCLSTLKPFPNIKLVTSSVPYSNWLKNSGFENTWIGGPPHKLPYSTSSESKLKYEFVSLGTPAPTKGFELILKALILGAQEGYMPPTLLHSKGYNIPDELQQRLSHVTFIADSVSERVFYEHLSISKCVLTYYDPQNYKLQDSAIVTEALALERYVLCSPIAFALETYGNDFFQFSCTAGEYNENALLKKMQLISGQKTKPSCVLAASQKAKLLSSPTIFLAKALML